MDRIEEIKTIIEYNSKMMSKYTQRIQELKEELDKIDSQIKWVPIAELDEKEEKDAWHARHYLLPSDAADVARGSRVIELDALIVKKDLLRKENLSLREELQIIKQNQNK